MSTSLKHYKSKRRNNKTQRRRKGRKGCSKMKGGYMVFPDDATNLRKLERAMDQHDRHLLALHSSGTCDYCKQFEPEWEKVLDRLTPHPRLTVAKLGQGATDFMNTDHYRKHNHAVNGVPTIVYYIVNHKPQEYDGERTADKIIDWLTKVMAENNLELTIKPKTHDEDMSSAPTHLDDSVIQEQYPEPEFAPEQTDMQTSAPTSVAADAPTTEVAAAATADAPSTTEVAAAATADVFPESPLPPASTLSNATETIKGTAETVDSKIKQGVSAVKDALTNDLNLGSLFSSKNGNGDDANTVPPIPPVPSLVGGRRRTRRRKHRRTKTKHSKKSKKSKKH